MLKYQLGQKVWFSFVSELGLCGGLVFKPKLGKLNLP